MNQLNSNERPSHRPFYQRGITVTCVKIIATAAVIWMVAFLLTIFDFDGSISESRADIFDISFFQKPNQERFNKSLESMGHPQPQVFDLNGNVVYFSVNHLDAPPQEVMHQYQREFVRQNLNDRIYGSIEGETAQDALITRLTGGISPIEISPDRIVMAGMLTKNSALNEDELLDELGKTKDHELFRGHRWVEIFSEEGSNRTTILASWSDENFSYEKMLTDEPNTNRRSFGPDASSLNQHQFDPEIPACTGCTRVNHFADLEDPRGYSSNLFVTPMDVNQMIEFYRYAMPGRGWEETGFQDAYDSLRRSVQFDGDKIEKLTFERGKQTLEIFVFPYEDRQTAVQTVFWESVE